MGNGEMGNVPIVPVSRFPEGFIRRLAEYNAKRDNDPKKIDSKGEWMMLEEAVSKAEESNLDHWGILMDIKRESLKIVQTNVKLREMLQGIGATYMVDHENGMKTMATMLTYEGVKGLGIDLIEALKDCGSPNTGWNENKYDKEDNPNGIVNEKGYLVNLDLYQQVALLKAILEKVPKDQRDKVGFYNLRASASVHKVLEKGSVYKKLGIRWMWTAESYQDMDENYPDEDIVLPGTLNSLKGDFCYRHVAGAISCYSQADNRSSTGAVIIAAKF